MKKMITLICALVATTSAFADCTLSVKDKSTGISESAQLVLIKSTSASKLYVAEAGAFNASYEVNFDKSPGTETLAIADEDGYMATSIYKVNSNEQMELNLSGKKRFATLSCE